METNPYEFRRVAELEPAAFEDELRHRDDVVVIDTRTRVDFALWHVNPINSPRIIRTLSRNTSACSSPSTLPNASRTVMLCPSAIVVTPIVESFGQDRRSYGAPMADSNHTAIRAIYTTLRDSTVGEASRRRSVARESAGVRAAEPRLAGKAGTAERVRPHRPLNQGAEIPVEAAQIVPRAFRARLGATDQS
jgi:hypothetical protein